MDSDRAYWLGIMIGLGAGIILGWTFFWFRVQIGRLALRRARRDAEDIHRILAFKKAPLRTMEKIAQDEPVKVEGPRHLRVQDPWWAELRDNPRRWVLTHLPTPMTPEQVAEQTYQEIIWSATRQPTPLPTATSTQSSSTPTAKPPAPWLGSTMKIVKASTAAPSRNTFSTLVLSGPK